jgi:hypothetical protein
MPASRETFGGSTFRPGFSSSCTFVEPLQSLDRGRCTRAEGSCEPAKRLSRGGPAPVSVAGMADASATVLTLIALLLCALALVSVTAVAASVLIGRARRYVREQRGFDGLTLRARR